MRNKTSAIDNYIPRNIFVSFKNKSLELRVAQLV